MTQGKPQSPFAVGERAIFIGSTGQGPNVECVVTSELYWGQVIYMQTGQLFEGWLHDIEGPFGVPPIGGRFCSRPEHLRKIPDDGGADLNTLTKWADCPFDPNRLIIKV